jgi:hypothetical protein
MTSKQKILGHLIFCHKQNCTKCGQTMQWPMQNWILLPPPTQGSRVQWQGIQLSNRPKLNNEGFNKNNSQVVTQIATLKISRMTFIKRSPNFRLYDHEDSWSLGGYSIPSYEKCKQNKIWMAKWLVAKVQWVAIWFSSLTILIFNNWDKAQFIKHDWIDVNVVNCLKDMIMKSKNCIVSIIDANTRPISNFQWYKYNSYKKSIHLYNCYPNKSRFQYFFFFTRFIYIRWIRSNIC